MSLSSRRGFSLIEIMIVLVIIATILSIAIVNYLHFSSVSKRTACIDNLRNISASVDRWAIDNNMPSGTQLTPAQEGDVYANYLRGGRPKCPSGGVYIINPIGANPQAQCTKESEGHKL